MIESFWYAMQRELLDTRLVWDTPEQLGSAIFEWIEAWYNPGVGIPHSGCSAPSTTNTSGRPNRFTPPPPERH